MVNFSFKDIFSNGVWLKNQGLVQFLGLCPLIAISDSTVKSLGLSLATTLVIFFTNITVSLIKKQVKGIVKIPSLIIIIAAFTTCVELLMQAFIYELYILLGSFVPLIVANGLILHRAEIFACKTNITGSALDGIKSGIGFSVILVTLGLIREILSTGKIFSNMDLLFGSIAANWDVSVFSENYSFLLFALPSGAFIVLGLLMALKNATINITVFHGRDSG